MKHITLGYGVVDGFLEKDNTGVGYDLLKAVVIELEKKGFQVTEKKSPSKRIIAQFSKGHIDAVFPIVSGSYLNKAYFSKWGLHQVPLYSTPLYNGGSFVIYTPRATKTLNNIADLADKYIGVLAGSYIPGELKATATYRVAEIQSLEQAFKLLKHGRIDAFVIHKNWAASLLSTKYTNEFHHGGKFGDIYGSFVTQQSDKGAILLAEINQIIGRMILDGRYQKIISKYPNNSFIFPYSNRP